jgi:hypothetical protein
VHGGDERAFARCREQAWTEIAKKHQRRPSPALKYDYLVSTELKLCKQGYHKHASLASATATTHQKSEIRKCFGGVERA